jgi:hypothetical protein
VRRRLQLFFVGVPLVAAITIAESPALVSTKALIRQAQVAPIGAIDGRSSIRAVITNRWAGYFTIRGAVTSVRGSWIVPRLSCANVDTRSSTWVGTGGLSGGALLQAGMYDNCLGGVAVQGAFAEQYPGSTVSFQLYIRPGDVVTATVAKRGSWWYAGVTDNTTHQSATARAPTYRGGTSAEWMAEAYGLPAGSPMTNFGSERLRAFLVDGVPARISRADVYEMPNVVATNPATGVYRLIYR